MAEAFRFTDPCWLALARENHKKYVTAEPFPHIVLDNFLPDKVIKEVLSGLVDPTKVEAAEDTTTYNQTSFRKAHITTDWFDKLGAPVENLFYQLNSPAFLEFLEALTGIEGLIPDPYLKGGGVHMIGPGGFLKIHADFNWHQKLKLDRRINFLLYLNPEWKEEYGGQLELWDTGMKSCQKKVLPISNRCVIFSTTDYSYHGHPDPLKCPEGMYRTSLALYYYSNGRPKNEVRFAGNQQTLYQKRQVDQFETNTRRKLIPSALFRLRHQWRRFKELNP